MATRKIFVGALAALSVCGLAAASAQTLPELRSITADPQAPDYCGIDFQWVPTAVDPEGSCGGASVADFDADGLMDIFLPQARGFANKLYHNLGGGKFVDEAVARGVADPVTASADGLFIDYDNDGDLDLFVAGHPGWPIGQSAPLFKLFRNTGVSGGHTFVDLTATAGFALDPTPKATKEGIVGGVAAADWNRDGFVDLFVSFFGEGQAGVKDQWRLFANVPNPVPGSTTNPGYTPRIFDDRTLGSGALVLSYPGDPWTPAWCDFNRDGWPDLTLCVDFGPDLCFVNNHDGTFAEVGQSVGLNGDMVAIPPFVPPGRHEMGNAMGDFDNDGDMDIHRTNNAMSDTFYRNDSVGGAMSFMDIGAVTPLNDSNMGWGTVFFDFDNDGDLDHTAANGFSHISSTLWVNTFHRNMFPQKQADGNILWLNIAAQPEVTAYTKIGKPTTNLSRGLVPIDIDNDGDLDLVETTNLSRYEAYRNTLNDFAVHPFLEIDLADRRSLNVTGSQLWLRANGVTQHRQVVTGSSFLCQESQRQHFGLGKGGIASFKWLVVRWPLGQYQIVKDSVYVTKSPIATTGSTQVTPGFITVRRSDVDDAGDMDADGHLTPTDLSMLQMLVADKAAFVAAFPKSPGPVVGDIDGSGLVNAADTVLWSQLPPH